MATHLYTHTPLFLTSPHRHKPTTPTHVTIRCGPRDNRGPLVKGRVLSSEAILAVQSLKRSSNGQDLTKTLSRLIKSDLLATLRELLRQNQCTLALQVFSTVHQWYKIDLSLYADVALALDRNNMGDDIDRVIEVLEERNDAFDWNDRKGLGRLIRAFIGANRRESTVRIYRVMKMNGWGVNGLGVEVDDYVAKVLSKGFLKFGEVGLAKEVDLALEVYLKSCLGRVEV